MILSVIVPMYNSLIFLDELFSSLTTELNNDIEIILVDDGSKDETYDKAVLLSDARPNVCVFHNDNHGVSYSRNFGIGVAQGKYLMFLDSDDLLEKHWCNTVIDGINQSDDADLIVFSKNKAVFKPDVKLVIDACVGIPNVLNDIYLSAVWSKIYKRKFLIDNNIIFNDKIIHGEDALFNIQAFIAAKEYCFIDNCIYKYRINNTSVTHKYDERFLESNIQYLKSLDRIITKSNKFNDKDRMEFFNYSFSNSIYLYVGKVSKIDDPTLRNKTISDFYKLKDYSELLMQIKPSNSLSMGKKAVYLLVKNKCFKALAMLISLIRKKKKTSLNGYYFVSI